jgi:hypothetical protein
LAPDDGQRRRRSKLPALMSLAKLDGTRGPARCRWWMRSIQSPRRRAAGSTGSAHAGTPIGSEEYEPDAKTREGFLKASGSDDGTDIKSFSKYYFGDETIANPYHYTTASCPR